MSIASRARRSLGALAVAAALPIVSLIPGCATPLADNAGMFVEGARNTVFLTWDEDYPWTAAAKAQLPRLHLFAQYRSQSKPVEQDLGAVRSIDQRTLTFDLPTSLRNTPDGSVCLFFSASRSGTSIPVRIKSSETNDTARFRFPTWETAATASTRAALVSRRGDNLEAEIRDLETSLEAQRAALQKMGVQTRQDCAGIGGKVGDAVPLARPREAVDPKLQEQASQRLCVRRARNLRVLTNLDPLEFTNSLSTDTAIAAGDGRRRMAATFRDLWTRWLDRTGVDYVPEVGKADDILPLNKVAEQALLAWIKSNRTDENRRVIATGLVEAFEGCLDDTRKQLAIKYSAWERARREQPRRDQLYVEHERRQCVAQYGEMEKTQALLDEAKGKRSATTADTRFERGSANENKRVILNRLECAL